MTTDNSVLFALRELQDIEVTRQACQQADVRARADIAQRAELEKAEEVRQCAQLQEQARAHAERVAAEEARLNVASQVQERTEDAEGRVEAMKAELAAIQAEREALHRRMLTPDVPTPARRPWPLAFALSTLICAVLATVLVVRATTPAPTPQVVIREVEVPVAAVVAEAPVPVPVAELVPADVPEAVVRPVTMRPVNQPTMRDRHDMALDAMDRCGDDPLCMLGD